MSDAPLEPRLTAEDVGVLRCVPSLGSRRGPVPITVAHCGLTYHLGERTVATLAGLAHLGYLGELRASMAWFRTEKGDKYLAALDAPERPAQQEQLG